MKTHFQSTQRLFSFVLVLILAAFVLTACGGSKGPAETVVNVKLTEYMIQMDKTSIPAGKVKFVIQNAGSLEHEVVLEPGNANDEPYDANGVESEAENIAPGTSATLEWTLDTPGDYQLGCHTPGHFEQGMFTEFTVNAAQ